ncbi:hypothetical protein V8F33_009329 [Rhypophila sp. PSN 637]
MTGVWEDSNEEAEVLLGLMCLDDMNNEKGEVVDILCVGICLDPAPGSIQIPSLISPRHMRAIWNRLRMLKNQLQVQEGEALFQRICEAYDKGVLFFRILAIQKNNMRRGSLCGCLGNSMIKPRYVCIITS